MRKRISIFGALLVCICLAGSAAADAGAPADGTAQTDGEIGSQIPESDETEGAASVEEGLLRIGVTDKTTTMDVHKTTEEYLLPLNIYERLFDIQVNEDGSTELAFGLAEDYTVSDDGTRYRFTLRDDAFFSDGTPVTASDVKFTFTRMLAMRESVQTDFADIIYGAQPLMQGNADELKGVRVEDDHHLEITLSEPFAGYIYQLATPSCSILSEAFVTEAGRDYGTSAELTMGSGPYMVTEQTDEKITLEKNPFYNCHEGESLSAGKVDILILPPALIDQKFQSGELDILDSNQVNPDVVENVYMSEKWEGHLVFRSKVETQYLMMNIETPPLNDIRIRKAVQMAIDRQGILDELYGGEGSLVDGIYPRGLIGFNEENQGWLKYDPEEAKRLVSEVKDAGEIRVELAASSQNNTRKLTMLEMIRQDLSEAGLDAVIVSYDSDSMLYLRKAGRLMSYVGEWSADFNDPDNFIYTFFGSRGKTLYRSSNYADEDVFKRITDARAIQDEEKRMKEYSDLEMHLVQDEAVWVPLFSTEHLFVLGERVERFTPFWAGWSSMYFKDVVLKQGR